MRSKKQPYRFRRARRHLYVRVLAFFIFILILTGSGFYLEKRSEAGHTTDVITPKPLSQQTHTGTDQAKNTLANSTLYSDPNSYAAQQAKVWKTKKPVQAAAMERLAALPTAHWLTSEVSLSSLKQYMTASKQAAAIPILVVYSIPFRDCGLYSSGGSQDLTAYKQFIDTMAAAINDNAAIIIIEPDVIAGINNKDEAGRPCRNEQQQQEAYQAIKYANTTLKNLSGVQTYIDAGNSSWVKDTTELANRLQEAGIERADGFSLNVSNFQTTEDSVRYGTAISKNLKGKRFVIDTSRNGLGPYKNNVYPEQAWCNPPGRALGHFPTLNTGVPYVDGFLYIKVPGESDGNDPDSNKCFDGPSAGAWWPEYALGLVNRWPQRLQP